MLAGDGFARQTIQSKSPRSTCRERKAEHHEHTWQSILGRNGRHVADGGGRGSLRFRESRISEHGRRCRGGAPQGDVSRLEQSASELISKISVGLRERRSEIDASFDRERAQRSVEQMRSSLEELAALAGSITADIASAANSTLKQSEPELKSGARALEDVAGSATSWIRTAIDPAKEAQEKRAPENRPPLDDL